MHSREKSESGAETMLITYHVIPGKEQEFQALLLHAWEVYRSEHLVYAQPHVVVRAVEDGGKVRFTEIFTWVHAPDNPPQAVKTVWQQEQDLCEARNGHKAIGGGQVKLITGE